MCASVYGSKADSLKRSAFSHKRALVGAFDPDRLEVHRGAGGRHLGHADLFPSVDFVKKTKQPLRTIRNGPHCLRSNMLHEGKHGVIEVKDLQKSYGELMAFGIALLGASVKSGAFSGDYYREMMEAMKTNLMPFSAAGVYGLIGFFVIVPMIRWLAGMVFP